jgi:ElaA protein
MIKWECKKFDELTPHELYAIVQLRNEVFVVEQNCIFQDADDKDQASWHFMGWLNEKLIAYTRLVPAQTTLDKVSIGRVVTSPSVRRTGIGKELMKRSIEQVKKISGDVPIAIGAQLYLKKFYESLGFLQSGNIYLEDDIEHINMILP